GGCHSHGFRGPHVCGTQNREDCVVNLETIRKRIDLIDFELMQLLNNRMELAVRSRRLKGYVTDAMREQEIFDKVKRLSHSLLSPLFTEQLYGHIISHSKVIQEQYDSLVG